MVLQSRQVDVSFEVLEITHHNGLGCSQHDTQTSLSLVGYRNLFKKILEETGEDIKFSFEGRFYGCLHLPNQRHVRQ